MSKDMLGNKIEIGDIVKVYSLIGKMPMMKGLSRVLGKGKVLRLQGIPSHKSDLVWVEDITSCHHPEACRLCFKGSQS